MNKTGNSRIITNQLVFLLLLTGALYISLLTGYRLASEFYDQKKDLEKRLEEIDEIYLPIISQSLWIYDTEQLYMTLSGLVTLERINSIEIIDSAGETFRQGPEKVQKDSIWKEYPLYKEYRNSQAYLGTVHINFTFPALIHILYEKLAEFIFYSSSIVGLLLIVIFFLTSHKITKPLNNLVQRLEGISGTDEQIILERNRLFRKEDEIDYLVESFNVLLRRINRQFSERELLVKEIHHRVKNNLQIMSSLLSLQADIKPDEKKSSSLFSASRRIQTMGILHNILYQSEDFNSIDIKEYLESIAWERLQENENFSQQVHLKMEMESVSVDMDRAIPCGLIVNEIVNNSLDHAFIEESEGNEIGIVLKQKTGKMELQIYDNGTGMPEKDNEDFSEGLGMKLINILMEQIHGEVTVDQRNEKGTSYTLIIPLNKTE